MLGLTLAGVLAIALALPVSESSRNQIIGLIGLVISGIFAFSSSSVTRSSGTIVSTTLSLG